MIVSNTDRLKLALSIISGRMSMMDITRLDMKSLGLSDYDMDEIEKMPITGSGKCDPAILHAAELTLLNHLEHLRLNS